MQPTSTQSKVRHIDHTTQQNILIGVATVTPRVFLNFISTVFIEPFANVPIEDQQSTKILSG